MKLNLAGQWKFSDSDKKIILNTQLPGDNYSTLLEGNKIPDPYYGKNELEVQWVAKKDWKWERNFSVTSEFINKHEQIHLYLSEVDTFARIYINHQLVAESENMFLPIKTDVKPYLKSGANHIMIVIRSPVHEAKKLAKEQPLFIPWTKNNTEPFMNLVRKVQCHAGWDWGISLIVSGVYGQLELIGYSDCVLENMYTSQQHSKNNCELSVFVEVDSFAHGSKVFTFSVDNASFSKEVALVKGKNKFAVSFLIEKPQLWYPSGYGEQPLYEIGVAVGTQKINKKIGLRKLEVINEKDSIGKSLIFRINGIDIFCKGANWIPSDALPSRQTPEQIRGLIVAAKEANMNMLRVWGGGQYEKEYFYEICDELGILIWQDLMFSCALYPSTKDFIASVEKELAYQAIRLRDHASLAIWCGDNEVIGALTWYKESKSNRDAYLVNYDRLNFACEKIIEEYDPTRIFWPSSPCAGPKDFSDNWHNDACGDMHYWSVWHGGKPFEAYYAVKPRFCSEFGYQSFPSLASIKTFCDDQNRNATAPVMEAHQKNGNGNEKIINMFSRYFRFPNGFENFLYLSQVQQALAIKTGVEFWRRLRPQCMGTLYWQLNDLWPVASWSSIEYNGHWKQLHYHAKRFYAPVMIAGYKMDDGAEIWVVNDETKTLDCQIQINIHDLNGKIIRKTPLRLKLKDQSSKMIQKWLWSDIKEPLNEVFVTMSISYKNISGKTISHENTLFLTEYKKCELPSTKIKTKVKQLDDNRVEVTLSATAPAFFVNAEVDNFSGHFDDNSFTLLPNATKKIIFESSKKVSLEKFQKSLTINHLRQTY